MTHSMPLQTVSTVVSAKMQYLLRHQFAQSYQSSFQDPFFLRDLWDSLLVLEKPLIKRDFVSFLIATATYSYSNIYILVQTTKHIMSSPWMSCLCTSTRHIETNVQSKQSHSTRKIEAAKRRRLWTKKEVPKETPSLIQERLIITSLFLQWLLLSAPKRAGVYRKRFFSNKITTKRRWYRLQKKSFLKAAYWSWWGV